MIYNIDFAVSGFCVLLLLYFVVLIRYNKNTPSIKQLRKLLVAIMVTDLVDIISCCTISYPNIVPLWLNYVLNIIFFESMVFSMYLFPKYVYHILPEEKRVKNAFDYINIGILAVYGILTLTTPFTHSIFYFDNQMEYQHGYFYIVIFLCPLYFFIYTFIKVIRNKDSFNKRQIHSIFWFMILAACGPLFQMIILPGKIILDFFFLSLAAFIVVTGLETPDFVLLENTLKELEENKKLLEEAKKKEEARSKVLHEMTNSASWSLTIEENQNVSEAFWSDELFWLLGYDRATLPDNGNMLWMESLHPDEKEYIMGRFTRGIQGIEPYDVTYRLRNINGDYRWYRGTGELHTSPNNAITFQGIIQDINDEKIKEEYTKERLEMLSKLEESQKALEEAVLKAESADKAKTDFLANMSHEIRTPINAVLGMNELIKRESSEANIQEYATNISDAGHALLSLINDVLDISKIESGRFELAPANYELADLVREVKNIMYVRFADKQVDFIVKNNHDIPNTLFGDEVRIRQILINLLNNAVKYTDLGTVTFHLDYERTEIDNQILLVMSVTDTGMGIKEEDMGAIFESFKRIDLTRNREREGTGLGLNITKSFVELMDGNIDVQSEYGKGSTFTVRIPQTVISDEKIGDISETKVPKIDINTPVIKAPDTYLIAENAKILVVDDVPLNLQVVKGLLKRTKARIATAISGEDCLKAVQKIPFDIILLDHMMPGMDGIETLKRIREDKNHPNQDTPIIMLTANAVMGAQEEYIAAGFTDYLSKPVPPAELESILIKYLPADKIKQA